MNPLFPAFLVFLGLTLGVIPAVGAFVAWYTDEDRTEQRRIMRKAVRDSKAPIAPVHSERQRKHYGGPCLIRR